MKRNLMGWVDISLPNISYCEDVKDVNYNPYNTVEFYVGEITSPWTVSIYTDKTNHLDVTIREGNKWYTYVLPKDKELYRISGYPIKKIVVKADISFEGTSSYPYEIIIPSSTVEASFKGSNTSGVTDMKYMFIGCIGLTSLDVSRFDTSNVKYMNNMFSNCSNLAELDLSSWEINITDMDFYMRDMFSGCSKLKTITMKGCSEATRTKIQNRLTANGITRVTIVTE